MSTSALSYNCKLLEKDSTPVKSITVVCPACDPDNPLAVSPTKCSSCKGSGRVPVAVVAIVEEIKSSRLELLVGGRKAQRAEYLEY